MRFSEYLKYLIVLVLVMANCLIPKAGHVCLVVI